MHLYALVVRKQLTETHNYAQYVRMTAIDVATSFPEVMQAHLDQLRRHLQAQPEFLLEADGGGFVPAAWNIFADLIGMDDQLEQTWQLDSPTDRLFVPVTSRVSTRLDEPDPMMPTFRRVTYLATNGYARLNIDMGLVHEWGLNLRCSDMTRHQATMCLIRYRRQPLTA